MRHAILLMTNRTATSPSSLRTWLYALVVLCYLTLKLFPSTLLSDALSVLSLAAILASLPATGVAARVLSALFLGGGSWMLYRGGATWSGYLHAYGEMAYLLALFVVVPVLSAPVRLGGYSRAIQAVLQGRVAGVFQLNCLVTSLAFVCGSFMSLAAVPIMMTSMESAVDAYPIENRKRFIAVSATYGYVLPILWTPVSGVVGVVLYSLHIEWLRLFPVLLALSVAGLFMNWLIFWLLELRHLPAASAKIALPPEPADAPRPPSPLPKLLQMVAGIVVLVVCIGLLERWLHIGLITVVTLAAIPLAFAWSAVIGSGRHFLREAGGELVTRLPRMADQFAIFLGAGFFASAMHLSGIDHTANQMFLHLHDAVGTQLFLLLMPVMALAVSFLGVHPLVAIALLGESLKPEVLGISPAHLAITLVGSSVLTYMQGPFSGTLGLVQSINHVSTFRLSLWNAPYAVGYFLLLAATILLF
jgi:hypothetical protein